MAKTYRAERSAIISRADCLAVAGRVETREARLLLIEHLRWVLHQAVSARGPRRLDQASAHERVRSCGQRLPMNTLADSGNPVQGETVLVLDHDVLIRVPICQYLRENYPTSGRKQCLLDKRELAGDGDGALRLRIRSGAVLRTISDVFGQSLRAREAEWELGTFATVNIVRHSRRAENHYAA